MRNKLVKKKLSKNTKILDKCVGEYYYVFIDKKRGEKMADKRKEVIEKIAREFPQLQETDKSYMAGYIMKSLEENEKDKKRG